MRRRAEAQAAPLSHRQRKRGLLMQERRRARPPPRRSGAGRLAALLVLLAVAQAEAGRISVMDPHTGRRLGLASDQEVLVRFKPAADRAGAHARCGGVEHEALAAEGWRRVELPPGLSVTEAIRRYRSEASVLAVQPNYAVKVSGVSPDDPLAASQYGLAKVSAQAAWEFERGLTRKVTIAVLDTGIDEDHPDLTSRIDRANWATRCPTVLSGCLGACTPCTGAGCTASHLADPLSHGTEVAGVAAAATDNAEGVAGVSWGATLLPVRIFDSDGCADSVSLSNALAYVTSVATNPAKNTGPVVVNMSVGEETTDCANPSDVVYQAADSARNAGLVLVAAAGNADVAAVNPYFDVQCPARIPWVVAVGATDAADGIASFSARGAGLDMVAPGVSIVSTGNGGIYAASDGTSFSSPFVAGVAALLRAAAPAAGPAQVTAWLLDGADDIGQTADLMGRGRLNAYRSVRLATRGTLAGSAGERKVIAFPNPWRGQGTVTLSVPPSLQGGDLEVKVFTPLGELVRSLRSATWDGKNEAGYPVASGIYLVLVKTDKGIGKGRIAVIR